MSRRDTVKLCKKMFRRNTFEDHAPRHLFTLRAARESKAASARWAIEWRATRIDTGSCVSVSILEHSGFFFRVLADEYCVAATSSMINSDVDWDAAYSDWRGFGQPVPSSDRISWKTRLVTLRINWLNGSLTINEHIFSGLFFMGILKSWMNDQSIALEMLYKFGVGPKTIGWSHRSQIGRKVAPLSLAARHLLAAEDWINRLFTAI